MLKFHFRQFSNAIPVLRHIDLKLFDLCPKAAGTSEMVGILGHGLVLFGPLSHGSGEVATASYTTQLGSWNICDIPKAKLCREQKAVDVFVFHSVLIQHVV